MKIRHWISAIVLLLLTAAAVVGWVWTRQHGAAIEEVAPPQGARAAGSKNRPAAQHAQVNQLPLQTARRDGTLAYTQEEKALANQAEKVADHEVDLAFFDAFRTAQENPPPLTSELKQLADKKTRAQQTVQEDQDNLNRLKTKLAAAPDSQKENLQDQINVAQAQLELDQDEQDDAATALEQAGGDPQAEVQRLKQEHDDEEARLLAQPRAAANPIEGYYQAHTLLPLVRAWSVLRQKKGKLQEAQQESTTEQQSLSRQHAELAAEIQKQNESRQSAREKARGFAQNSKASSREDSKAAAQSALDALQRHRLDQKNLADLGKRIRDEQKLHDIYGSWIGLVDVRQWAALHNVLEIIFWILLVVFFVYVANRAIERFTKDLKTENKRLETLRAVLKFAAQTVGVIAILLLIFGTPDQTTTILGLAGAGLTVAMKDFIMAFFGWFSLMGKNGIRVGDWVEINGVGGEVVQIGLLKTTVLETGNWTDAGHPTGRKVSFMNSFAIEGHFFNFTTSGQWMWDELQLTIPANQDPYPLIDGIQKVVTKETEANAREAEQEWQHTTTRYRVQSLSATPAINVRPSVEGVVVSVRYITRANERHETRRRLYAAVLEVMHGKREQVKA